MIKLQTKDPLKPNYARQEYMDAVPDMDVMDHVLGGVRAMRTHAKKYIFQWPEENSEIYKHRCECEEFFEATKHIMSRTVGMLFAKPITMTWNGAETALKETIWPNLDQRGTAGAVLVKRYTAMTLRYGLAVALTDHPPKPTDKDGKPINVHPGNMEKLGLRPRVAIYNRRQVPNWLVDTINNQTCFTRMTLCETADVPTKGYGVVTEQRFRMLQLMIDPEVPSGYLATWTLFRLDEGKNGKEDRFTKIGNGIFKNKEGVKADFLPVSVAYANEPDQPMEVDVPLLGVAWANIGYHRKSTDIQYYEEVCAYPRTVIEGELAMEDENGDPLEEIPAGPGHALQVEKGGKAYWDELKGSSLEQLKSSLHQKLVNLGHMGNGILTPDRKAEVTAEENRQTAVGEQANVATVGQGVQDSVNLTVEHVCWFVGIQKKQAATVAINMDFERKKLTAQEMDSYAKQAQANLITREMFLERMIEGDRLKADTNVKATIEQLDREAPKVVLPDDPNGLENQPIGDPIPIPRAA